MRAAILTLLSFSLPIVSFAQSKENASYSLTVGAGFTNASIHSSSNDIAFAKQQVSFKTYADSIQNKITWRANFSAHLWYNMPVSNKLTLQLGLGYTDLGFRREQNDIKLADETYPGIGEGKLLEFSNNKKDIYYDYRFHYIQVPVWLNYNVFQSKDFKTNVQLTGGLSVNILAKHHLTAKLQNFSVDEEEKFQIDSTGYDARTLSLNLNAGMRIVHKLDKKTTLVFQPMFGYQPISSTNEPLSVNAYQFMLHAGIILDLNMFKNDK